MIITGITFKKKPIISIHSIQEWENKLRWTLGLTSEEIKDKFLDRLEIEMAIKKRSLHPNWRKITKARLGFIYYKY